VSLELLMTIPYWTAIIRLAQEPFTAAILLSQMNTLSVLIMLC